METNKGYHKGEARKDTKEQIPKQALRTSFEPTMIKEDGSNREEKRRYHTEYSSALVPSQTENVHFLP